MVIERERDGFALTLPVGSWYGDRRFDYLYTLRKYRFPKSWDIEVFEPDGADDLRPMDAEEIGRAIQEPIGSERLRKLAEGRRSATIIVDDLSRPTPAFALMPHILEELKAGGIGEGDIKIIIGLGTHRPLKKFEQRRKLGRDIVDRIEVINHNAFTTKITKYKRPGGGPDIGVHQAFGEADLKIAVGGITPHGGAGFGGGAKAVVPSVSDYRTIRFNHAYAWEGYGTIYPEKIESACIRKEMEEIAGLVGLDFIVNVVSTPYKGIAGVFSGHFVKAHRKGCLLCRDLYQTEVPKENLDIAITNGYPFDTDIGQSHRGSWGEKFGDAGVILAGARDGWAYHGDNARSYKVYLRNRRERKNASTYEFKGTKDAKADGRLYYYSEILDAERFYEKKRKEQRVLFTDWDALVEELCPNGRGATVGVFPYGPIQLEKK